MIEYRNRLNYRTILYIYKVRLLYTLLYYDNKKHCRTFSFHRETEGSSKRGTKRVLLTRFNDSKGDLIV